MRIALTTPKSNSIPSKISASMPLGAIFKWGRNLLAKGITGYLVDYSTPKKYAAEFPKQLQSVTKSVLIMKKESIDWYPREKRLHLRPITPHFRRPIHPPSFSAYPGKRKRF